jgi:hypothetical protein
MNILSLCALCKTPSVLRNSHIVPEFLYAHLYDSDHKFIGITGVGSKGSGSLQKGLRQKLLCESCEQYINEYFEKPFYEIWIKRWPLPNSWVSEGHSIDLLVDYSAFKLFHLSVVFRMSVSSLATYHEVNLGPYEDTLRNMLLERRAGEEFDFPMTGLAVFDSRTNKIRRDIMSRPRVNKVNGKRIIEIVYGGMCWHIFVSTGNEKLFDKYPLEKNGNFHIEGIEWRALGVVQEAASLISDLNE